MEQHPSEPAAKKGGFSFLKCCLIALGLVLVVTVTGVVLGVLWFKKRFDPEYVAQVTNEIVPCTIPAGYEGKFGWTTGARFVLIAPKGTNLGEGGIPPLLIMALAPPEKLPEEQLREQIRDQMRKQGLQPEREASEGELPEPPEPGPRPPPVPGRDPDDASDRWDPAKPAFEEVVVRGKKAKAYRGVSRAKTGDKMLTYFILLEQDPTATNPAGQAAFLFMGPDAVFDRKAMDAFLASIK